VNPVDRKRVDGAPTLGGVLSSELLGFPPDARVLIVNADDLGMSSEVNAGVVAAVGEGIATSCSLMVPCPGAEEAMWLLRERPHIPFGIHLTLVRDHPDDRWAPVSPAREVPTLVEADGLLPRYEQIEQLLTRARIDEVEREFRAQLDVVLAAGLHPTHLDFHSIADGGRDDVLDLTVALAAEHGLAVRVWLEPGRERARRRGRPVVDHPFLDSTRLDPDSKADRYAELLRALPAGLTEWAVHPAAVDRDGERGRRADLEFLVSPRARELVAEEGVVLIDYRPLRQAWKRAIT
jgi:predicted glycoside hydrolase/deacetylase ChbG (UPF0249 family)